MPNYENLINVGGEIRTKDQSRAFTDPTDLGGYLEIDAATIDWSAIETVTPESLEKQVKFDVSGAPQDNIDNSAVAVASAEEQAKQGVAAAEADVDTATSDITNILTQLEGEPGAQAAAEDEAGIAAFKQQQADVQGQIAIKTAEYRNLEQQEEQFKTMREGIPGFTLSEVSGQQAQITREFRSRKNAVASDLALLQAESLAISGKQGAAQAAVDRATSLKYDTLRLQLDTKKFLFDIIRDDLTKAENEQLAIQEGIVAQQEQDMAIQMANEKDKNITLLNQMQAYPDAGIQLTDSLETANTKIAQNSKIYRQQTRLADGGGGTGDTQETTAIVMDDDVIRANIREDMRNDATYQQVLDGIILSQDIKNKDRAKLIASELFGEAPPSNAVQPVSLPEENISSDFITEEPIFTTPQQQAQQIGGTIQRTEQEKQKIEKARQKAIRAGLRFFTNPVTGQREMIQGDNEFKLR